jgi:hypothetical protein
MSLFCRRNAIIVGNVYRCVFWLSELEEITRTLGMQVKYSDVFVMLGGEDLIAV